MVRLLVPHAQGASVRVDGASFHYLTRVLRLAAGDPLEVFDGRGRSWEAQVQRLSATDAELALGAPRAAPSSREVVLVKALSRADRLEWALEKCTELGATAFRVVATARAVVKVAPAAEAAKRSRWRRIVEESARQCGRSDVPRLDGPEPLDAALAALPPGCRVLFFDEEERAQGLYPALCEVLRTPEPVALVVGPEGGFERREVDQAKARGALTLSLGKRILRNETAAMAALAALQLVDGNLGS